MRRAVLAAALCVGQGAWAQAPGTPGAPAAEKPSPALPDHPDVAPAREAYNAGRYNEAARRFLALCQAMPEEAGLYRALARARSWAKDAAGAVVAYRLYLEMAPGAGDAEKVAAELELVLRQVDPPPPPGPPAEAARSLEAADVRARAGRFVGPDGAFGAMDAALEAGYLGPGLARARAQVDAALVRHAEDAVDRWWRPPARVETSTLTELAAAFSAREERPGALPDAAIRLQGAVAGLAALESGRYEDAVTRLAPVATADPRLRAAQAIALDHAGRAAEGLDLLEALAQVEDDPRVPLLRALMLKRAGKPEAAAALRAALGE